MNKPFENLDSQLDTLESHNTRIKRRHRKRAKKLLIEKNYFNLINSYEDLFLKNKDDVDTTDTEVHKQYFNRTKIFDFLKVYNFDSKLASLLFFDIHNIEIELRTKLAHYFCEYEIEQGSYTDLFYQNQQNYSDSCFLAENSRYVISKTNIVTFTSGSIYVNAKYIAMKGDFTGSFFDSYSMNLQGVKLTVSKSKQPADYQQLLLGLNQKYNKTGDNWNYLLRNLGMSFNFKQDLSQIGDKNYRIKCKISDLSYSDYAKLNHKYISKYTNPPLWVVINTLTLGELKHVFSSLPEIVKKQIMNEMSVVTNLNQFEDILEVLLKNRNFVYHHDMISFFRVNISGDRNLLLYDALIQLTKFNNFKSFKYKLKLHLFFLQNTIKLKNFINRNYKERIGYVSK